MSNEQWLQQRCSPFRYSALGALQKKILERRNPEIEESHPIETDSIDQSGQAFRFFCVLAIEGDCAFDSERRFRRMTRMASTAMHHDCI